jgi:hypothetical protein
MAENQKQHEFYQISHTGVEDPFASSTEVAVRETSDANGLHPTIVRAANMKMCNFGAGNVGRRMSIDYTRTETMEFIDKGIMEGAAEFGLHDLFSLNLQGVRNENPLVWGSTVKYTWNDEMFKTGMDTDDSVLRVGGSKSKSYPVKLPAFDVMDTKLVDAAGINADRVATWQKNFPSEGWRSFGGKYDFLPYSGGGFTH